MPLLGRSRLRLEGRGSFDARARAEALARQSEHASEPVTGRGFLSDPRLPPEIGRGISSASDPRIDARLDPRIDPRIDPRLDPRLDPRIGLDPRLAEILAPPGSGRRTARRDPPGPANSEPARDAASFERAPGRAGRPGFFETCANPRCGSGWLKLWRSRRAPVFEGGWCCSPRCMRAQIESSLGRELDTRSSAADTRPHRIPLGLLLLEQGWITRQDLRSALDAQRIAGAGRLGAWLVRRQAATEEQVTRALALQWSCPVLGLEFHRPEAMTALVPRLFVDAFGALPLRVAADRILYLGFEDRPDPVLALALERMTGLRVESGVVPASSFRPAQERLLAASYPRSGLVEGASGFSLTGALLKSIEKARPADARLVRVHGCLWLRLWLRPQIGPIPEPDSIEDLVCSVPSH